MFYPDKKETEESEPLEKIQMKNLIIAFLILGFGCFAAFVVFLLEMIRGERQMMCSRPTTEENKICKVH
jgi:hypothetical protein